LYVVYVFFFETDISSVQALFAIIVFVLKKKKKKPTQGVYLYLQKKNKNYLFHSRVFLSTFLSLRIYLNNNNNNSPVVI